MLLYIIGRKHNNNDHVHPLKFTNGLHNYVTVSAKTVPNGTFGISRNTILKH